MAAAAVWGAAPEEPAPRALFAGAGASAASGGSQAVRTSVPTDLCYGMRVGIRSCADQRYVAAFPGQGSTSGAALAAEGLDLEVSGYHPFRQSDATDRTADCPSEWVVLQGSWQQHEGPIHVGDDVCLVKELVATGKRRKDRYQFYLALAPSGEGTKMEPTVERLEACTDLCKWTLLHADDPTYSGKLQADTPLLLRGKYREVLAVGQPLWSSGAGGVRSLARRSGRSLVCRDAKVSSTSSANRPVPEMRFRLVKAGVPFSPEPWPISSTVPAAVLDDSREFDDFGSLAVNAQEQALLEDLLFCLLGVEGTYIRRVSGSRGADSPDPRATERAPVLPEVRFDVQAPPGADLSTVQYIQKVLPLCEHYAAVQKFVDVHSQYAYGTVNQALCAAIRELLREFSVKVGQLETALRLGNLTIAKLWYHIQPSMATLALLHRVASHVFHGVGGHVLNGIEEVMGRSSLSTAQDLCEHMLQQASRPYFEMVSKWIYEGRLDDPYNEFFITESPRAHDEKTGGPAADFWQKHFTLKEHSVPQFLKESREKILHAGKYLHVFFSASTSAQLPPEEGKRDVLRYSCRRKQCIEAIDAAYRRASAALLGLFMSPRPDGLDLPGRLRSMRSFFFLAKADWFGQLMDNAVGELEQTFEAEMPSLIRLEGLLQLAIASSSVGADPYRDDISCTTHSFKIEDACKKFSSKGLSSQNEDSFLRDQDEEQEVSVASGTARAAAAGRGAPGGLTAASRAAAPSSGDGVGGGISDDAGIRCFTLKYRTSWPLSIVFSRTMMLKYQVIFRHLLYCRYVERKLVEVWVDHQYTKDLGLDSKFSPSYCLRQRMLHFCRDYIYYASAEVLQPQSHRFLKSLEQAETVDVVLRSHEGFLDTCLRELLLTEREALYKHLSKVLETCHTFADNLHRQLQRFEKPLADNQTVQEQMGKEHKREYMKRKQHTHLDLVQGKQYAMMISRFKNMFEKQLQGFLRLIREESSQKYEHFLSNMLTRLDYNDYYSSELSGLRRGQPSDQ